MSLTGLVTFIAGTKAKASEVNNNFSKVKSFVDGLETSIASNSADILLLENGKADINGSATVRFAVADAVNDTDATNKETVYTYTDNSRRYINGFKIAKTASDTISVTAGSCYDSTFESIMILDSASSVQNTTQSKDTTYYVYVVAKANGIDPQVIISTSSTNPTLPSGYTLYRNIGVYDTTTDTVVTPSVNTIASITSYSTPNNDIMPNYSAGVVRYQTDYNDDNITRKYKATCDGFILIQGQAWQDNKLIIDGVTVFSSYIANADGPPASGLIPVSKGSIYEATSSSTTGISLYTFFPRKGVVG